MDLFVQTAKDSKDFQLIPFTMRGHCVPAFSKTTTKSPGQDAACQTRHPGCAASWVICRKLSWVKLTGGSNQPTAPVMARVE
ncbi:hypothetical protein Y1Q_0022028 [Alligator mississippiensis]|uniref:Uncharacterized protein n=1 Tax=Alligator mississippiensis TaxID=8496 RepID=A0A151NM43_ALLMI|nr:hypothetical protein Y1Q_0022028 [Alligator mississippiensis]